MNDLFKLHSTKVPLRGRALCGTLLVILLLLAPSTFAAQETRTIVAIADIHGAYDSFTAILQEIELVDDELRWTGGDTILVQTGDILDRGPQVRENMDLLMRLQEEAAAQGGEVVVLLGNHETMNLVGHLPDTTPPDTEAFIDDDSRERRDEAWKEWTDLQRNLARERGEERPRFNRGAWEEAHPLGYVERMDALAPEGYYGRWLRGLPTVHRIDDMLFMHAGLNPTYGELSTEEMNARVADDLATYDAARQAMIDAELITRYADLPDMIRAADATLRGMLEELEKTGRRPDADGQRLARTLEWVINYTDWQMLDGEGLLWFRGLASWPEDEYGDEVRELLEQQELNHIILGHTVQADGYIRMRFDGGVFLNDTGMLTQVYRGRPSALEIKGGVFTARYIGEHEVLLETEIIDLAHLSEQAPNHRPIPVNLVTQAPYLWMGPDGSPLPFTSTTQIDDFLRRAEILSVEEVGTGKTRPRRLELELDGVRARAIFHNVDLYREEKLLAGRFYPVFRDSWRSQVAAYRVARMLGIDNVAPTVARDVDGEPGSVQLWLENDGLRTNADRLRDGDYPTDVDAWLAQEWTMRVFDALIFNDDRHGENVLVDNSWKLWMIDHTRAFQHKTELRDPDLLNHIDRALLDALIDMQREDLEGVVGDHLDRQQVRALMDRRDALVRHFRELIDERGESEVLYGDAPSEGPAIGNRSAGSTTTP